MGGGAWLVGLDYLVLEAMSWGVEDEVLSAEPVFHS